MANTKIHNSETPTKPELKSWTIMVYLAVLPHFWCKALINYCKRIFYGCSEFCRQNPISFFQSIVYRKKLHQKCGRTLFSRG